MADEIDLIRARISIVDLVSQRVALRRTGKSFHGLCPFHEDRNPSFTVTPDLGRYRCWSCGAKGDIFNWVMETQKVEFAEALQILADQAGVALTRKAKGDSGSKSRHYDVMAAAQAFFTDQLRRSETAQEYCRRRGLDQETLAKWGLGYGPPMDEAMIAHLKKARITLAEAEELFLVQGSQTDGYRDRFRSRLTIPIRDEKGRVIAYGGRIIGEGTPKYINSSDTPLFHKSHVLYGMDAAKESMRKTAKGVLVEGYMDVIACHRAGVDQAVASLGTSLTEEQVKILKRWCETVVVLYDRDEAGQKAAEKATDMLLEAGLRVRIALPPSGEDPDSLLTKKGGSAVQQIVDEAVTPLVHRVGRLQERRGPKDDAYWEEAAMALSYASFALELEQMVPVLAADYPNAPDKAAAMQALRGMAATARKRRRSGREAPPPPVSSGASAPVLPRSQQGLEGRILRALMQTETRRAAWQACGEEGLFRPGAAAEAALAVASAFPAGPPEGLPSGWLPQVPEPHQTLLGDLVERPEPQMARADSVQQVSAVSMEDLEGAIRRLREHRSRRRMDPSRLAEMDDEAIRARLEELKRAKGGGLG